MRLPRSGQRGFTLLEVVVSLGLTGLVLSMVTGAMFQAWGVERNQRHEVVATAQLRNAADWFFKDATNANSTDLVDGVAPVSTVLLNSTDANGIPHITTYSLNGTRLVRTYDGSSITVAQNVASAAFSLSGGSVFATLQVPGARGAVKSLSMESYMRMAGP